MEAARVSWASSGVFALRTLTRVLAEGLSAGSRAMQQDIRCWMISGQSPGLQTCHIKEGILQLQLGGLYLLGIDVLHFARIVQPCMQAGWLASLPI